MRSTTGAKATARALPGVAVVFFVANVANGQTVGQALVDAILFDPDIIVSLGESGQRAVDEFEQRQRQGVQRGLRNRYIGSGIEDIANDLYEDERSPI